MIAPLAMAVLASTGLHAAVSDNRVIHQDSTRLEQRVDRAASTEVYPYYRLATSGAIRLYQKFVSPGRGTACPMHPHCSAYGLEAFQTHGPLAAFMMSTDRLMRCGRDLDQYRAVVVDGFVRYDDPAPGEGPAAVGASSVQMKPSRVAVSPDDSLNSAGDLERRLFLFARLLANVGDFDRAITEYLRFLAYYPGSSHRSEAELALVRCYYDAGQFTTAVAYGEHALTEDPSDQTMPAMMFTIGLAAFRSGDYARAHEYFERVSGAGGDIGERAVMAQGLTYAYRYDWQHGEATFSSVSDGSDFAAQARYCARLCRDGQRLGRKNPSLAGVLAIVPGLGYLYDGYYQTALSALIVNGLFMWGTYEAFDQDHPGLGVTLAVFGFGWYSGNIYGSITSARRRNEKERNDLLMRFDLGCRF